MHESTEQLISSLFYEQTLKKWADGLDIFNNEKINFGNILSFFISNTIDTLTEQEIEEKGQKQFQSICAIRQACPNAHNYAFGAVTSKPEIYPVLSHMATIYSAFPPKESSAASLGALIDLHLTSLSSMKKCFTVCDSHFFLIL
jgi:hypothetical protein